MDFDQRVAIGAAIGAFAALAAQPQHLGIRGPRRNLHVQRASIRQSELARRAIHRIEKVDRKLVMLVAPTPGPGAAGLTLVAEHLAEDVGQILFVPASRLRPGPGVVISSLALGVVAIGWPRRRLLLPGGIDLTAIELATFHGIGQKFVGGGDHLEPLLGLLAAWVEVGMVLLRQVAIGFANIFLACVTRHAKRFVRVLHEGPPLPRLSDDGGAVDLLVRETAEPPS